MEEDLSGRLLVATPLLGDPNFRRAVVLVVEDEPEEGTLGVVLNRPTEVPVGQVLESWTDLVTGPSVVFRGGPVAPNSALALAIVPGDARPSTEELAGLVKAKLRSTRTPEVWAFREALPYNDTGKLLRRQLRAEMSAAEPATVGAAR